jgi:hypothetical protein
MSSFKMASRPNQAGCSAPRPQSAAALRQTEKFKKSEDKQKFGPAKAGPKALGD